MPNLSLNGPWQIRHDPLSQGAADRWWAKPPADKWLDVNVPSAWQSVLGPNANGLAWYRRALPAQALEWARSGGHVRLGFASVATECRVWVGQHEIGRHLGDWMPFEFDITPALRDLTEPPHIYVRVDQYHAPRPAKGVVVENGHIAKGFHDVLSIQHAGLWGDVWIRRTGPVAVAPNGIFINADPESKSVKIVVETTGHGDPPPSSYSITNPKGETVAQGKLEQLAHHPELVASAPLAQPIALWSPDSPALYKCTITLGEGDAGEKHEQRFGFRTVRTGGPDNSQILLNGSPLMIRGMLSWGHEPRHVAPAPPPEQIRAEFQKIRELGFNCICLCMFYPPEVYFDIADETGMLLWQEHPIWKSRMTAEFMPEYRRCYEAFFRRDRRHPSVVIVSATCEHEAYDPELGRWWWEASAQRLPRTIRQLQTGFLEQTPPDQTELYDDHVYDNCGRWVCFLRDMQERIKKLPPRPFVMGETIISNAWPEIAELRAAGPGDKKTWWLTRGLDECEAFERNVSRRHGDTTLARFKKQGDRFGKEHRKFQAELFRMFPRNAGFVTNSIRDVPICRLGFMNDLDRWRFSADETRPWLSDAILLLETPEHLRAFVGGQNIAARIGVSNFGTSTFDSAISVKCGDGRQNVLLRAAPGEIRWTDIVLKVPGTDSAPRTFEVTAEAPGIPANRWTLVALPALREIAGVSRLDGLPFTAAEQEPEFEERGYSSGWCLPCATWKPRLPDLSAFCSNARSISANQPIPADTAVLVTHRLTRQVHEFLKSGGRCVLLSHRHAGGLGSKWINLWGQLPLLIESTAEHATIRVGESDAISAMLLHDLTRWTTRAVPTEDWGDHAHEHVDPIVRYVWTHDAGVPKCFDAVFSARIERGLLVVSTLDHSGEAGRWMLHRVIEFAKNAPLDPAARELDIGRFVVS